MIKSFLFIAFISYQSYSQVNEFYIPKNSTEKIIFLGILNKGQSLLFSYTSKKDKSIKYDDLKHFFMERNRRGKKIDKKFLLEKGKTDYNIE